MNELAAAAYFGKAEKTMTVKEVAEALGVSVDTIKNCIRRIMPHKMQNGKTTYLAEQEIACISKELKNNCKVTEQLTYEAGSQVKNTTTELEVIANAMQAFQELKKLYEEKNQEYKRQLEAQKPKVEFYDTVTGSKDTTDMKEVAKVLSLKGFGRNNLFEFLRTRGILDNSNLPYQRYIDRGYFRVIESKYRAADGEIRISMKTVVFQKGIDYIRRLISQEKTVENC